MAGRKFVSSAKGGKSGTASQPGTNVPQSAGKLTLWDVETMKAEVRNFVCLYIFIIIMWGLI